MTWFLALFQNKLFRQIGGAVLFIGGIFLAGYKMATGRAKTKKLKEALETHKRINDADSGEGDTDADLEWLRKRGKS